MPAIALSMFHLASTLCAQQARRPSSICLDSIPVSAMRRVPVYATAEIADSVPVSAAVLGSVDVSTQAMAEATRTLLGAGPGQLPPGEPSVTWRHLDHRLTVVAKKGDVLAWTVRPPEWLSDQSLGDEGAQLLARAFSAARTKGDAFFLWSDDLRRDSLTWIVRLEAASLGTDGTVTPPALRAGFPVFTVLMPPSQVPEVDRIRTNFPMMRTRGYAGNIRMQFVIDTSGRAIPSTIRDVWPANEPRVVGAPAFAYDTLVRTMRTTLQDARFAPARLGGCVVSQLVQQAFNYRPSR